MCGRYMLDTNICFIDYKAMQKIIDGGNELFVSVCMLEELDNHKSDSGISGYNVRKSIKWFDENDSKFTLVIDELEIKNPKLNIEKNDNK